MTHRHWADSSDVNPPSAAVYLHPFSLRQALPKIPIPLRPGDPPLFLELQPLIDSVYRLGRYEKVLDYTKPPPEPALDSDDTTWIAELLGKLRRPK